MIKIINNNSLDYKVMFHLRNQLPLAKNNRTHLLPKDNKQNYSSNLQSNYLSKPLPKLRKKSQLCNYFESQKTTQHSQTPQAKDWQEQVKSTYTNAIKEQYSDDILTHLTQDSSNSPDFLQKHSITANLRAKMVDWMIEVLSSYKMSEESFFKSIQFMDAFFMRTTKKLQVSDLHIVGVASMFTATKYEEIYPLKMNAIYDKICRKKFSKKEILQMEQSILLAMDFELQKVTPYELAKHILAEFPITFKPKLQQYFCDIVLYLLKLSLHSYEISQFDGKVLVGSIVYLALKTVEQVQEINAEEYLDWIVEKCEISGVELFEVSQKALQHAKNFKVTYPTLSNLRKFNNVEYTHQY